MSHNNIVCIFHNIVVAFFPFVRYNGYTIKNLERNKIS